MYIDSCVTKTHTINGCDAGTKATGTCTIIHHSVLLYRTNKRANELVFMSNKASSDLATYRGDGVGERSVPIA